MSLDISSSAAETSPDEPSLPTEDTPLRSPSTMMNQIIDECKAFHRPSANFSGLELADSSLLSDSSSLVDLAGSITSIDLSRNLLTTLPFHFAKFTLIRGVNLSRNALVRIPRVLGDLPLLEDLDLSENLLTSLTDFESLKLDSLHSLDLSHNKVDLITDDHLSHLTHLEVLNVSFNHVSLLPNALETLPHLRELRVAHNQLTDLPQLVNCSSLRCLDISDNPLTHLDTRVVPHRLEEFYAPEGLLSTQEDKRSVRWGDVEVVEVVPENPPSRYSQRRVGEDEEEEEVIVTAKEVAQLEAVRAERERQHAKDAALKEEQSAAKAERAAQVKELLRRKEEARAQRQIGKRGRQRGKGKASKQHSGGLSPSLPPHARDHHCDDVRIASVCRNLARLIHNLTERNGPATRDKFSRMVTSKLRTRNGLQSAAQEVLCAALDHPNADVDSIRHTAQLCMLLCSGETLPSFDGAEEGQPPFTFKRALIRSTQAQFERAVHLQDESLSPDTISQVCAVHLKPMEEDDVVDEEKINVRKQEEVKVRQQLMVLWEERKRRDVELMASFVGHLYVHELLASKIIFSCFTLLLSHSSSFPNCTLATCRLLEITGSTLEAQGHTDDVLQWFAQLRAMGRSQVDMRSTIKELFELKKRNWKARKKAAKGKKKGRRK